MMLKKVFLDHPAAAGETYVEHLAFTSKTSWELVCIGFALAVHGLIPALFSTTASGRIARIYEILSARAARTAASIASSRKAA